MIEAFLDFVKGLEKLPNVRAMDTRDLEKEAAPFGRKTAYGSLGFFSNVRNRSAGVSVVFGSDDTRDQKLNDGQKRIFQAADSTLEAVTEYLKLAPLICVKRTIGDNGKFNPRCTLYLSTQRKDNVRQAYLWANTLRDYSTTTKGPDMYLVCIPEWQEGQRQVLCFPEQNLTLALGSDYAGEVKMGFLRMAMWDAKEKGMLSLHAGTKVVQARQLNGQVKSYGLLFFGLSGTGKSTHACHDHGLVDDGEGMEILQDDIVFLENDGSALGTEQGFYLKTEGITQDYQPVIYKALTGPETLLENVMMDAEGGIDLGNLSLGSNGRAVIPRTSMSPYIAENINMPSLSQLDGVVVAFITRRMTVLPIVAKLTPEQAASAFMMGESIETSAGDPMRAGQSVRVVGTNPFLIGNPSKEGQWFYDFVKSNEDKVQCYLLNTGGVGEIREPDETGRPAVKQKALRVAIPEMAAIIRGIARNTIKWRRESHFGTLVPEEVQGMDISKFNLDRFYTKEQAEEYVRTLREEREAWLGQFSDLPEQVVQAASSMHQG